MEVPMAFTAHDLADLIVEKKVKREARAFEALKQKVVDATRAMASDLTGSADIDLTEEDLLALTKVTEGMRELDYKFRFIEVQDSSGETFKHKLHISIAHLLTKD